MSDDTDNPLLNLQQLLVDQHSQNQALLAQLDLHDHPEPAQRPAPEQTVPLLDPSSTQNNRHRPPHSFSESSEPDQDLISPYDPVSSHAWVRDASVKLLHVEVISIVWPHIQALIEEVTDQFKPVHKQLHEDSFQSEQERRLIDNFLDKERRAAIRIGLEKARHRLCRVARLETQITIGSMLLNIREDQDLSLSDDEHCSKTAKAVTALIEQAIANKRSALSPIALDNIDIYGRINTKTVQLPSLDDQACNDNKKTTQSTTENCDLEEQNPLLPSLGNSSDKNTVADDVKCTTVESKLLNG